MTVTNRSAAEGRDSPLEEGGGDSNHLKPSRREEQSMAGTGREDVTNSSPEKKKSPTEEKQTYTLNTPKHARAETDRQRDKKREIFS